MTLDPRLPHRLSAVCFADIVGYSGLTSRNEGEALTVVGAFQEACSKTAERYGGRVVKFMGDGALIEFSSTEDAARAARALLYAFDRNARSAVPDPPALRIGLHLGEVAHAPDGDIYGEGLNVAARLQQAASPGQVLASEDVWRQLRGRPGIRLERVGEKTLKGIDVPAVVYDVSVEGVEHVAGYAAHDRGTSARAHGARGLLEQLAPRRALSRRGISVGALGLLLLLISWRVLSWSDTSTPPNGTPGGATAAPGSEAPERSIAVLPFSNIGGSAEDEYFSDGMTEEILANLARIDDLRVVSRTSVMQYKGTTKLMGEIAQELGVSKILEGSVRRVGDRIRITAQLIDARTDEHLWVETYDRQLTDVLEIQAEIALEIASQLEVRLSEKQLARFRTPPATNPTAYDFYLRGKEYLKRQRPQDIDAAIALLQESIGLDPDFAPAHAGLATAYVARHVVGDPKGLELAMAAARRAIQLDPTLADGQVAVGNTYLYRGQNRLAREAFLEAIELEPNNADAMGGLVAASYVLGRYDDALIWAKQATAIEPTSAMYPRQVGFAFTGLGDLEQSDLWLRRALQVEPDNGLAYGGLALNAILRGEPDGAAPLLETMVSVAGDQPRVLAFAAEVHLSKGDYERSRSLYERVMESIPPDKMVALADLGFLLIHTGEEARGRQLLGEASQEARTSMAETTEDWLPPYTLARVHATLGQREDAYRNLEIAIARGWHGYYDYGKDPLLDPLRGERRFRDLMEGVRKDLKRMREAVTAQT